MAKFMTSWVLQFQLYLYFASTKRREASSFHNSGSRKIVFVTSLAVQGLRLRASTAGGTGSIPGRGAKIPHAAWRSQKKKQNRLFFSASEFVFLI